jgi:pseudouridine synthase
LITVQKSQLYYGCFNISAMEERLQKLLSQWGIASRRQAEQMILAGRVRLNGKIAHLGQKANSLVDQVEVDGRRVQSTARPAAITLLLNKPIGVVCTCFDPHHRMTVMDLLPPEVQHGQGVHPVGRLDVESTGALLLTNDGELTFKLTHPRCHVGKTYQVLVAGSPSVGVLQQWRQGVMLAGRKTWPASVRVLDRTVTCTRLEIVLNEGRNRQIRRVAAQLGHPVLSLHRTAIGPIQLESLSLPMLSSGSYRALEDFEITSLKHISAFTSVEQPAERQEQSR